MGLFSKLRGGNVMSTDDAIARKILTMPLITAAADGKIEKSELMEVMNLCAQNPVFLSIGADRTHELALAILADIKARGMNQVFEDAMDGLSPALRETAFCFSVRTAVADGRLDESEKDTLAAMSSRMGISIERFKQILDVLFMLQRSAAA